MIETKGIMSLAFLKKEHFTGSCRGMQFRLEKVGDEIRATVFPGPFCYDKTPDGEKTSGNFPFSEDGLAEATAWLNERYEEKSMEWKDGERLL